MEDRQHGGGGPGWSVVGVHGPHAMENEAPLCLRCAGLQTKEDAKKKKTTTTTMTTTTTKKKTKTKDEEEDEQAIGAGRTRREEEGWVRGSARTFVRCFLVASGGKTLLNVLLYLFLLRRTRRPSSSSSSSSFSLSPSSSSSGRGHGTSGPSWGWRRLRASWVATARLVRQLIDVRYGLFLASYSASWKTLSRLTQPALASSTSTTTTTDHHQASSSSPSSSSSSSSSSSAWGACRCGSSAEAIQEGEGEEGAALPSSASSSEVAALPGSAPVPATACTHSSSDDTITGASPSSSSSSSTTSPSSSIVEVATNETMTSQKHRTWKRGAVHAAVGAVSGLSVYFLPKSHRKMLALYSLTRSGEFFARYLAANRFLPATLLSFAPHVDVALMALSASQILYSYIMERQTLDPTYASFLIKFGGKDVRVIDSIAPMRRGGKLNRAMFLEWAREQNIPDVMGCLFGLHHNVICDVIHPGSDCISHFIGFTYEGFWRALPMYATLHSITTTILLLFKLRGFIVSRGFHRALGNHSLEQRALTHSPNGNDIAHDQRPLLLPDDESMRTFAQSHSSAAQGACEHVTVERKHGITKCRLMASYSVKNLYSYIRVRAHALALLRFMFSEVFPKLALNIARSSLFLGLYCASGWFGACIAQRLFLMRDVRWFYPWLALPGLASLIEVPARRRELALYCLPKAMESLYTVLKKYDQVPWVLKKVRDGEVLLFSVSSAITLFCYLNERKSIKPTFLRIMDWLWA